MRRALVAAVFPVLGVWLGDLLVRGFSWWDLGVLILVWVFLSAVGLIFFSGRARYEERLRRAESARARES